MSAAPPPTPRSRPHPRTLLWTLAVVTWAILSLNLPPAARSDAFQPEQVAMPASPTAPPAPTGETLDQTIRAPGSAQEPDTLPDARAFNETQPAARLVSREWIATELLSHAPDGLPADHAVIGVALAADGQTVAFATRAANLLTDGSDDLDIRAMTGDYEQVYVLDRNRDALELITRGVDGQPGNGWSSAPALSPDGRFVAFYSWASNLVPGDTNAVQDAFVYDRQTLSMARVSISSQGQQGNDRSGDSRASVRPAISADGRWVAFHSAAGNLVDRDDRPVPGASISGTQVYLHDLRQGVTLLISADVDGNPGDHDSIQPALSADGRFIAFQSRAANLGPNPSTGDAPPAGERPWQIWLVDRAQLPSDEAWTLVSRGTVEGATEGTTGENGAALAFGNGDSTSPALSGDGQRVAFQSAATNLALANPAGAAANAPQHIYLFDRTGGEAAALRRVSVASVGAAGNHDSSLPALSLDGRYVAFVSTASNLVSGDANGVADVFLHDLTTRHTSRVSVGVTGVWSGVEADGPSLGPPALAADGSQIAFVSSAANLDAPLPASAGDAPYTSVWPAQLYLHARRPPPTYALAGRILNIQGRPIAQAIIRAGPHRAESDDDGRYQLPALVGGTYTLSAEHSRYSFSPPRRITSVLGDMQGLDFTGFAGVDQALAFLDLPFAYDGRVTTFLQALRDTGEGGLVDAWFDHAYPDYSKTGALLLWDGRVRDAGLYNEELGCYQHRCYDGHDGIDFAYRAHLIAREAGAIPVLPAAPGRVVHVVDHCDAAVADGVSAADGADAAQTGRWCNRGYGNEVIVYHDNGYFTRYSHLDAVWVQPQAPVTRAAPLGAMGSTGNSYGIHLHFGVYRDNGNARWDGDAVDLPVDPFGWAGSQPDPWVAARGGPVSRWLWRHHPTAEAVVVGSMGGVVRDVAGNIQAVLPGDAFQGQARFELAPGAPEGPIPSGMRSVGRAFWLRLLDWLETLPVDRLAAADDALSLAQPLTLHIDLAGLDMRHLDLERLTLYRWGVSIQQWEALPTTVDEQSQTAIAYIAPHARPLGNFDLQAPLRCPQDAWEPDDSYFAAVALAADAAPMRRLFDVAGDEDWFRLELAPGRYVFTLDELGPNVLAEMTLFDADGITELTRVTELTQASTQAADEALTLTRTIEQETAVYVRLRPQDASAVGCESVYVLRVETLP